MLASVVKDANTGLPLVAFVSTIRRVVLVACVKLACPVASLIDMISSVEAERLRLKIRKLLVELTSITHVPSAWPVRAVPSL